MSTTEESEVTTDADDDLLPTGTVVQAEPIVEELPEGGLTSEAAAEMLPSGDAADEPSEPDPPTVDVEVLAEDDLFYVDEPAPKRESAMHTGVENCWRRPEADSAVEARA